MKLVVGLGNPGKEYTNTRHNVGFMVVDYYAKINNLDFKKKYNGLYCINNVNNEKIILLKPQSFMNLSGDVVRKYYDFYNLNPEDLLVIYDDVSFDVGDYKIKRGGSSAGHNGINDILQKINNTNVYRIKIGTSKNNTSLYNYVLGNFSKKDQSLINELIPTICNIIDDYSTSTIDELMLKYNTKEKNEREIV